MIFQLAWGQKVTPEFRQEVIDICLQFHSWTQDHANWLMSCMAFETGETFSPNVRNGAGSGAIGLIQFMPATAAYLGTSPHDLIVMTAIEQLAYVQKYFKPYADRIASLSDMYMAILLPKYVGKPDDSILFDQGIGYRENSGLDADKDGKVTKAEATAKVREKLTRGLTLATEEEW
jgi:hypothetical protein